MRTLLLAICMFVLLGASASFADEVNGVMMVVKGDIKVTSAKDAKTEAAKVGRKVFPGDTITAGADARAKIVMSDKNILNISPDSKITIEKYASDAKSDSRTVELKVEYGKVRATVEQKYDGEKNKFNIKTPTAVAGVRGTDFITGFNSQTRQSSIVTFSGTVAVGTPGPGGQIQNPVFVKPGQSTSVGEGKAPEAPKPVPKEDLNKMNSDSNAESKPTQQKESGSQSSSDKKEEKKDEKKEEAKKEEPKKEEPKKEEAKKEEPKKEEPKKEEAKKQEPKQDPKQEANKQEPKQDSAKSDQPKPDAPKDQAKSGDKPASGSGPSNAGNGGSGGTAAAGPGPGAPGSPAGGEASRSPASIAPNTPPPGAPPMPTTGSMIDSRDLGPAMGSQIQVNTGPAPVTPVYIPPVVTVPQVIPSIVNEVIKTGPVKTTIIINR